ncbi:MAG: deoxynucleoside kinase [Gammaproteobacteria bacterium]|nr:deoxynucleoside kinase [Gammaproteobacteria bacterium]NNF50272.1 deoxynucleoside kinase [Woeseiaceae bacterium]MBT8095234.1 deoxynucleoside kinase [Gammaproteobacteria bacterium]MBT8105643.1 deoxynucleoside kinase [Gammaproteobacteria bacterium]NNK25657.1 deoxynucleoside kinase [Woeseiaceae bacterium]
MSESRYIAIEGPIGVGKTALARRLAASLSAELVLEEVEENPFLERFYRDGKSAALPAQMFFLFARVRQIEALRQSDLFATTRISDYLFTRDRLFAELNLDTEELKLYEQIAENLNVEPPVPDLVIYLQASVDSLLHRLARRNARYDRFVDRAYLEQLTDAYARFFHDYDDGPLLIVNASQIDPVNNATDYDQLFRQIENTTGGRHFFNPVAAALA